MKGYKSLHVNGCGLCGMFTGQELKTKLYYPEIDKIQEEDDFIIIECEVCKQPLVIVSDHITELGKEQWGRILYRCRELFGGGIRLSTKSRFFRDHWHAHISGISKDIYKLPDLRYVKNVKKKIKRD